MRTKSCCANASKVLITSSENEPTPRLLRDCRLNNRCTVYGNLGDKNHSASAVARVREFSLVCR